MDDIHRRVPTTWMASDRVLTLYSYSRETETAASLVIAILSYCVLVWLDWQAELGILIQHG